MPPPPPHLQVRLKQAFDMLNAGRTGDARGMAERILKAAPREPNALYLMGVLDHRAGDLKSAAAYFENSRAADPRNPAALSGIGIVRLDQERFAEAARIFEDLRRRLPREPAVLNNLGIAYKGQQRYDRAVPAFEAAIQARPDYAEAYANLGGLFNALADTERARAVLETGARRCPRDVAVLLNLAECYFNDGDLDRAIGTLRRSMRVDPSDRETRSRLASLLINKGGFDEAHAMLRALAAEDPADPRVWFDLADLVEARPGGADRTPAEYRAEGLAAFKRGDQAASPRPILCQRLAQAFEAEKDYESAFHYYALAQDAFKAAQESVGNVYDRARTEAIYDGLIAHFETCPPPAPAGLSDARASRRPIFIVGMPRSGTSLLEQVLASHPAIHGAGELMVLPGLILERLGRGSDVAGFIAGCDTAALRELAAGYLAEIAALDADSPYLTDKLPTNFVNTGLIRLMFPGALILNAERHPLDVCWSVYVQKFGSNLLFDHDLGDIGHYYRQYDRLMTFWRRWDPSILPVRYEAMVADMQAVVTPILDRLDLDWDPAMARFFETDRAVRTASRLQVRRPIYSGSVQRWRRFEGKLDRLRAELGALPARYEKA